MQPEIRARRTEIDVAKGFALFLVVFGHVLKLGEMPFNWIFSFHMPAFFFLSGMTFRPEKYRGYGHFLREKLKKRILPYFIITFIGFVICMLRPDYRAPVLADGWREQLIWIFYCAKPKNLYIGQVWFLVALFMAELFAYTWFRFLGRRSVLVKGYSLLVFMMIAVHIRALTAFLPLGRLPWKIDSGLGGAIFVIGGCFAARYHLFERLRPAALVLIPVCTLMNYYFGPRIGGYVNMSSCLYSPAPYYFTAAFLGIAALVMGADVMRRSRFWQFCGRYSLPIFAAQTFAIYFVVEMIARFRGITYTPMADIGEKMSLAISVAAFALMVAVVYLVVTLRKIMSRR